jgi:phosphate starvation-inducible PhoH-like protein
MSEWKTWQQFRDESVRDKVAGRHIKPLSDNQRYYIEAIERATITFAAGVPGSGKSYVACGVAARLLAEGKVKRVVLSRPLVQCKLEKNGGLGYLKGDLSEKTDPYMRPLLEVFEELYDKPEFARMVRDEVIETVPLELMRGSSFKDSFILLDEGQNASFMQLHMLLTRIDKGSKVVVTGDPTQRDVEFEGRLPFLEVMERVRGHKDIAEVWLTHADVQRHPLVAYVDKRLSKATWKEFSCPNCAKRCHYEGWAEEGDSLVRCWHCGVNVELLDGEGRFAPILVEDGEALYETSKGQPRP